MKNENYDLIGDIHGEAAVLRELLARLGYREERGAYRHPERRAIFLGDYIDRGPAIRETLRIVRGMVEAGAAIALCGNHELDVLMHDTPDGRGGWLRSHDGNHTVMHAQTHAEFADRPDEWREWLRWLQTLPLWLELDGLRAVHACWDATQIAVLGDRRLDDELLHRAADPATPEARAVRQLLKGPEIPLPEGVTVPARHNRRLRELRLRWWQAERCGNYRADCMGGEEADLPIPPELAACGATPLPDAKKPIFIGHYWLLPQPPALLAPTIACLDYSVAGGGPLVAYRWDGERMLEATKFVFDSARLPSRPADHGGMRSGTSVARA